jgi:hypothetical protein
MFRWTPDEAANFKATVIAAFLDHFGLIRSAKRAN